nr:unnamed protein product [Callosobruchus analis]
MVFEVAEKNKKSMLLIAKKSWQVGNGLGDSLSVIHIFR